MPGYERTPFFGFQSIFREQAPIAAMVSTDTVQAIPDSVHTALTFATPLNLDPLGINAWQSVWDAGTPGQFTITHRGFYLFGGSVEMAAATYGRGELVALHNGVVVASSGASSAGNTRGFAVSTLIPAGAGDTCALAMFQSSGGDVNTAAFGTTPNMWIVRIR